MKPRMSTAIATDGRPLTTDLSPLTCAACSQLVPADDSGTLASHMRSDYDIELQCVGSYTKGYPPRSLPEAPRGLLGRLEIVDEGEAGERRKHIEQIFNCAKFLNALVGGEIDITNRSLTRAIAHTAMARKAAVSLIQ